MSFSSSFSLETVRAVARLLDEGHLSEIIVESTAEASEQPAQRLVVRREVAVLPESLSAATPDLSAMLGETPDSSTSEADSKTQNITVGSPTVGFFRHGAKPIGEGATVSAGQTLGIVESLKVPSDVTTPVAGRVVEILASEGQGVGFGQPLFIIEPQESAQSEMEASS